MNIKKGFSGFFVLVLVLIVSACGSNGVNGSGEATELELKEVQAFMDDKKTGFLYVKSALDANSENDRMQLREIERVAETEKIDFYVFDENAHQKYISDLGVDQYSRTFAFYQNGEQKEVLDFTDLSEDNVPSEVEKFVQNAKEDYLK